jgi:hypothetical protein
MDIRTLRVCLLLILSYSFLGSAFAQQIKKQPKETVLFSPIVIKLDKEGESNLRFLTWHQLRLSTPIGANQTAPRQVSPTIRRSRMALLAKISPKFLIWTHVGMNNTNLRNLTFFGGDTRFAPDLIVHDAWGEFKVNEGFAIGGGLHYWNGMTRLASASTISMMTLDQPQPFAAWHSLGVTDQLGRHLGIYFKGQIKKLDYRVAINTPSRKASMKSQDFGTKDSGLTYDGVAHHSENSYFNGNTILEGYVRYNFWDTESTVLSTHTGTYLGKKSVLGVGIGFFAHPRGMYKVETQEHQDVTHFALDIYLDKPVHQRNALNAYLALQTFDYGPDYVSRWAGTGNNVYGQLGYYLGGMKIMPYAAFQYGDYEGLEGQISTLDLGLNYFIHGHNAKLTLEYHRVQGDTRNANILTSRDAFSQLRMQLQLFW